MTVDSDRSSARLPTGYRARPFADSDREPLVVERTGPMEQRDAGEWRAVQMEKILSRS